MESGDRRANHLEPLPGDLEPDAVHRGSAVRGKGDRIRDSQRRDAVLAALQLSAQKRGTLSSTPPWSLVWPTIWRASASTSWVSIVAHGLRHFGRPQRALGARSP
jgi:hypothetical protein